MSKTLKPKVMKLRVLSDSAFEKLKRAGLFENRNEPVNIKVDRLLEQKSLLNENLLKSLQSPQQAAHKIENIQATNPYVTQNQRQNLETFEPIVRSVDSVFNDQIIKSDAATETMLPELSEMATDTLHPIMTDAATETFKPEMLSTDTQTRRTGILAMKREEEELRAKSAAKKSANISKKTSAKKAAPKQKSPSPRKSLGEELSEALGTSSQLPRSSLDYLNNVPLLTEQQRLQELERKQIDLEAEKAQIIENIKNAYGDDVNLDEIRVRGMSNLDRSFIEVDQGMGTQETWIDKPVKIDEPRKARTRKRLDEARQSFGKQERQTLADAFKVWETIRLEQ